MLYIGKCQTGASSELTFPQGSMLGGPLLLLNDIVNNTKAIIILFAGTFSIMHCESVQISTEILIKYIQGQKISQNGNHNNW